jgi:hypothetical protein
MKSAEKLYYQRLILSQDWEFLNSGDHGRRIEIDNVIGYAGTQRFWNGFILPSFATLFNVVNYNLSLSRTEYVVLPELTVLNELARKKGTAAAIDAIESVTGRSYHTFHHGSCKCHVGNK